MAAIFHILGGFTAEDAEGAEGEGKVVEFVAWCDILWHWGGGGFTAEGAESAEEGLARHRQK